MPRKRPTLMVVTHDGTMRPARENSAPSTPRFPIVVYFDRGKAVPRGSSLRKLRRCADWLVLHRQERVIIIGHANQRGWEKAARVLANARAAAVRDLLAWLGARPSQLVRASQPQLHRIRAGSTASQRVSQRIVRIWRATPVARTASASVVRSRSSVLSRFRVAGGHRHSRSSL